MIKTSLAALALGTCIAGSALAADDAARAFNQGMIRVAPPADTSHFTPAQDRRAAGKVLFSNLGTLYPTGVYECCSAWGITQSQATIAVQFTPAQKGKAIEIDAGMVNLKGTNSVTITLWSDYQGKPDHPLVSSTVTGLGPFQGCCQLAIAPIKKTALKVGTPYWVSATAPDSSTTDLWNFNTTDQVSNQTTAQTTDGGNTWTLGTNLPGLSLQVIGQ